MEAEFKAGFAKYKTAAERDASLAEFHEMAAKGNTTVKEALSKYVNMENVLRADTVKGLELIAKNAGMSLREVAAKVLGLTPDQAQNGADPTHESVTQFAATRGVSLRFWISQ
jgi:predicted transcriptional regulator